VEPLKDEAEAKEAESGKLAIAERLEARAEDLDRAGSRLVDAADQLKERGFPAA